MIIYLHLLEYLRFGGDLQTGHAGHVSGPKLCDGIFYPRVFAKKLLSAVRALLNYLIFLCGL